MGAIAEAISGIVQGVADTGYGIFNNERNYRSQQKNLEYQKQLQQTIFDREDNAVQRRVADLKSAGLSPVLAAGSSAGSGGVVSTSAPRAEGAEIDFGINNAIDLYYKAKEKKLQIESTKKSNDVLSAQEEYYKAQTAKANQETSNLEVQNASQELANQVDNQKYQDYLYNRGFDVGQGRKIGANPSTLAGVATEGGDRSYTLMKKGSSFVGNFWKKLKNSFQPSTKKFVKESFKGSFSPNWQEMEGEIRRNPTGRFLR